MGVSPPADTIIRWNGRSVKRKVGCKLGMVPESAFGAGCNVIMVPDLTKPDEELKSMLYGCAGTLADIIPYVEGRNEGCSAAPA